MKKKWKSIFTTIGFLIGFSLIAPSAYAMSPSNYGGKVFIFDPKTLIWSAYDHGDLVRSGRGSGGQNYCADSHHACHTPVGVFKVWRKGGADCKSSMYPLPHGGAPMQYCMFFSKYYAVHGSNEVRPFNASHGCIRILPSEAAWLSKNFMDIGTTVVVKPY